MNWHEGEVAKLVLFCEAAVGEIRLNAERLEQKMVKLDSPQHQAKESVSPPEFGQIRYFLGQLLQYIKEIQKQKLMGKPRGKGRAITGEKEAKVKRWLREGKPCSVAKLAEKLKVSRQTIYNFLKTKPDAGVLGDGQ